MRNTLPTWFGKISDRRLSLPRKATSQDASHGANENSHNTDRNLTPEERVYRQNAERAAGTAAPSRGRADRKIVFEKNY
jgi:hypothetical protein